MNDDETTVHMSKPALESGSMLMPQPWKLVFE